MGMIRGLLAMLLGAGRGSAADLAALLREAAAQGAIVLPTSPQGRTGFDRLMDAVNRLPRPLMALGTVILLGAALVAPEWFAARMEALSAVPEALWWLIGAIISLYFGARHQSHEQAFQRELVATVATAGPMVEATSPLAADAGPDAALTQLALSPSDNGALSDWGRTQP